MDLRLPSSAAHCDIAVMYPPPADIKTEVFARLPDRRSLFITESATGTILRAHLPGTPR